MGLSTTTEKFEAGLKQGMKALDGFASKVRSVAAPVAQMSAGFVAAGVAVAGAFAARMADAIDKTGDAADRIGTTTAALSELRYAAKLTGSDAEGLDAALLKMNVNLGKAATEGGPAADALKKMGLDAAELARMDPAEAFRKISGGFQKIPTDAEKAQAAVEIFGKSGVNLLNTLSSGPAELNRFGDEFRKFGGSISETSRQQVAIMMDSLDRAGAAVEGAGTQLAVQLSPLVMAAAEQFTALGASGGGMGEKVGSALQWVGDAAGVVADIVQNLQIAFVMAQKEVTQAIRGIVTVIDLLGQALEGVINLIPGMDVKFTGFLTTFRETLTETIGDQAKTIDRLMGEDRWSTKVESAFARIRDRSKEMASAVAKSGGDLKRAGAQFENTAAKTKAADAAIKKYADDAHDIYEKTRTPLEKYQEELAKIDRAHRGGAIDDQTADRARKAAGKDLGGEAKFSGAMELGSQEARSAILRATTGRTEGMAAVEKNTQTTAMGIGQAVNILREINAFNSRQRTERMV